MKKIKLSILVSLLLIAAMLLSACSSEGKLKTISSFDTILNPNYDVNANTTDNITELPLLDGYELEKSNKFFAVFQKDTGSQIDIKVVSMLTGEVLLSTTSNGDTGHTVTLYGSLPVFMFRKNSGTNQSKTRYTLYDATGSSLVSTAASLGTPKVFADMILYGTTLYAQDENGKLTEASTIPENLTLSAPDTYSEKYFYYYTSQSIEIYDRDFNYVSRWDLPHSISYLEESYVPFRVLNNGNVFIQYQVKTDAEAEEYDLITFEGSDAYKYNLCTMILEAKTGKTTKVKTNYYFSNIQSAHTLATLTSKGDYFADKLENIAKVYPIVDKRIDTSTPAFDYVLLKNNGEVTASLKLAKQQTASIPTKITNDKYIVSTLYGRAIVNKKGETLLSISNDSLNIVGEYIIGEQAIYNLNMEIVYSLKQNNGTILGKFENAIFVYEEFSDTIYKVLRLKNGSITTVCTVDLSDTEERNSFTHDAEAGYYIVYQAATDEYTYYNSNGELLLKGDFLLRTLTVSSHGTAILVSDAGEYFFLTK